MQLHVLQQLKVFLTTATCDIRSWTLPKLSALSSRNQVRYHGTRTLHDPNTERTTKGDRKRTHIAVRLDRFRQDSRRKSFVGLHVFFFARPSILQNGGSVCLVVNSKITRRRYIQAFAFIITVKKETVAKRLCDLYICRCFWRFLLANA